VPRAAASDAGGEDPVSVPARVLIFDPDRDQGLAVAGRLRRHRPATMVTVVTTRAAAADLPAEAIDVGLINLADRQFEGLAVGAEISARFPWVETVFWFDVHNATPSAAAARSVGIRRVIPLPRLADWLDDALPELARMARAHREHLNGESALPPLPRDHVDDEGGITPLPEAERRFRETYLRRLLADSASNTIAARRAGLPYTTFYSMLKKLNLR
jgi:DNA-binding NtrC family response regulator